MDDDDDVDSNDKLSHGYSHYEDIEVLDSAPGGIIRRAAVPPSTTDNLYLDPRRPTDHPISSLRRYTTYRSDRYGYEAMFLSVCAQRASYNPFTRLGKHRANVKQT